MTKTDYIRPNLLGDLRAEADNKMLSQAFIETSDYRSLIETSDRIVVIGRRGTGKSALTIRLNSYLVRSEHTEVVRLAPEEYQVIGIRPLVKLFGEKFSHIRAGSRLIWRYVFMMESAQKLSAHYKASRLLEGTKLEIHLSKWKSLPHDAIEKLRHTLNVSIKGRATPEDVIAALPVELDLSENESTLKRVADESGISVVFLVDKLDEGYEPDDVGVGFIDGLIQAAIDVKTRLPSVKPLIFLRDNIFRAVQKDDPDFSRNIEGHILRLHWEDASLFNFVARRIALAFNIEQESSLKIWNKCTVGELKGKEGFQRCLYLTLFRPRDLLALLNEAFFHAGKQGRAELILEDVESTAKIISQNRLEDLKKEYSSVLPGLPEYIGAFNGKDPQQDVGDAVAMIENLLAVGSTDPLIQQDFLILNDANAVIRGLYSVGFLGIQEPTTGSFIFCHDGRAPDRGFSIGDKVLVHPCYWIALNSSRSALRPEDAEEIYDEYDIEVSSETPAIRNIKIRALISELDSIEDGGGGATQFEEWCYKAIRICFAKGLRNVELKPNRQARSRRDIVATNLGDGDAWERIYKDYGTRQVTFEVKNYKGLESADYQQIQSYLSGEYGRLAFVVTRDETVDLYANKDVEWVRELYLTHKVLIIKLTGKYLAGLLYKLKKPQKHDDVNNAIHRLLDTYTRLYMSGQTAKIPKRKKLKPKHKRNSRGQTTIFN